MLTSPSLLTHRVCFYERRDHCLTQAKQEAGEQEATNPILPMMAPGQVKAKS